MLIIRNYNYIIIICSLQFNLLHIPINYIITILYVISFQINYIVRCYFLRGVWTVGAGVMCVCRRQAPSSLAKVSQLLKDPAGTIVLRHVSAAHNII